MQVTETVSDGLRREYRIVIAADDLDARLTGRIEEMKPKIHLKGFRPGKAPLSFLKKTFGKSMMGEIVEQAVSETSQKAVAERELKPAFPPKVDLVSKFEQVVEGKSDLEFTVKVDLMPEFELADVSNIKVEKLVADVTDEDVDAALMGMAQRARTYSARSEGELAENGDAVRIDFAGRLDGEEFSGGKADDFELVLGSGQLVPGFEDQLVGAKAGEHRKVEVRFPADYPDAKLASREVVFEVTVRDVRKPDPLEIDDELAKKFGLDSLVTLKEGIRDQLKSDYARASRMYLKRRILDALDGLHSFSLPPTMVEGEFEAIWKQVQTELQREEKNPEDAQKTEEQLRKEYHDIAERRVRLGLVLARIGEQNGINVAPDEVQRAIAMRARQFPGQEQRLFKFYSENPQAQAEIRAPIFEEKVVDFIAELAQITERKVDRETLFLDPDEAAEKLKSVG